MTKEEEKILLELAKKYGNNEIKKLLDNEKLENSKLMNLFLEYFYTTNIDPKTNKYVNSIVSKDGENQEYISNGVTSVFKVSNPIIKKNWISLERKIVTEPVIDDFLKIKKGINKVEKYFLENWSGQIRLDDLENLIMKEKMFSIIELKLIKQILQNPVIYMTYGNPFLLAKGENGTAYVLGKDKKGQRTF